MKPSANITATNRNYMENAAAIAYTFLDAEHFETLDNYRPSPELRSVVERFCGAEWQITANGFWTRCTPPDHEPEPQGWKIHISATEDSAEETLQRVIPLLAAEKVAFKFASDRLMVRLSTSKNWPRSGGGKFITIYPKHTDEFVRLLETCHQATQGLSGPYILSDRPHKDSKVVFYRYGGHSQMDRVNAHGFHIPLIVSPGGQPVPDERVAFYKKPDWVTEPFAEPQRSTSASGGLKLRDRYLLSGAIKYSNMGGLYKGTDLLTGQPIICREARPFIRFGGPDGTDAITLLKKEARILEKLNGTGIAPRFVDLFCAWEHWFLVEEHVQADPLWGHTIEAIFKRHRQDPRKLLNFYRDVIAKLVRGLQTIHEHQIVLRDFTKQNVLFTPDGQVKFIDFELAYELDRDDAPVAGYTEGYASAEQISNQVPSVKQDYYALGALILDSLAFTTSGLGLNRSGVLAGLKQVLQDLAFPAGLLSLIEGLIQPDPEARWSPEQALKALDEMEVRADFASALLAPGTSPPSRSEPTAALKRELQATVEDATRYLEAGIEYHRHDRLWPSSYEVFLTNPVNFEFGATGIASVLQQIRGTVPAQIVDWITRHSTADECPPGLFVGLSGVAVFLLNLGEIDQAKRVLKLSADKSRICELHGLYEGMAGWGLANLHFWMRTLEDTYLEAALEMADRLLASARSVPDGVYWEEEGRVPLGLGRGGSGISLFLTYLNAIHPSPYFIQTAERALDYEMSQAKWIDHTVFFTSVGNASTGEIKSPGTRHGTAGVGAAAIRLYAATGKEKFRALADVCAYTLSSRYTNKLWQDYGLAGFGELLLDMFYFLSEQNYLNNAFYIAEGILPYCIERPKGTVFAGPDMVRICCDWGSGAAGIASFLHRVLHPQTPRLMFLDSVLRKAGAPQSDQPFELQLA